MNGTISRAPLLTKRCGLCFKGTGQVRKGPSMLGEPLHEGDPPGASSTQPNSWFSLLTRSKGKFVMRTMDMQSQPVPDPPTLEINELPNFEMRTATQLIPTSTPRLHPQMKLCLSSLRVLLTSNLYSLRIHLRRPK